MGAFGSSGEAEEDAAGVVELDSASMGADNRDCIAVGASEHICELKSCLVCVLPGGGYTRSSEGVGSCLVVCTASAISEGDASGADLGSSFQNGRGVGLSVYGG